MPSHRHADTGATEAITATRSIWRGHLRPALVSCSIALFTVIANQQRAACSFYQSQDRTPYEHDHP